MMRPLIDPELLLLVADGLDHPECVSAGPDGQELYAGGEAGQLYRVMANGSVQQFAHLGGFVAGIALDARKRIYACVSRNPKVVRVDQDGAEAPYGNFAPGALIEPNYPAFDQEGNLYISDSGHFGSADGRIWRIDRRGETQLFDERVRDYPNGLALTPDGAQLLVVESASGRIVQIQIRPDGSAGAIEEIVRLRQAVPDGIAVDISGRLYIACYRPDCIYRLGASEIPRVLIGDWRGIKVNAPTNVAFYGPELTLLALSGLGGHVIRAAAMDTPGAPVNYPADLP